MLRFSSRTSVTTRRASGIKRVWVCYLHGQWMRLLRLREWRRGSVHAGGHSIMDLQRRLEIRLNQQPKKKTTKKDTGKFTSVKLKLRGTSGLFSFNLRPVVVYEPPESSKSFSLGHFLIVNYCFH